MRVGITGTQNGATPQQLTELKQQRGGGTWATVRYAKSQGRPVLIITLTERNS